MAHPTQTQPLMPRSSPASMSIGSSPAGSATTCRKRRHRPSLVLWWTSIMPDRRAAIPLGKRPVGVGSDQKAIWYH